MNEHLITAIVADRADDETFEIRPAKLWLWHTTAQPALHPASARGMEIDDPLVNAHLPVVPGVRPLPARRFPWTHLQQLKSLCV